MTLDTTWHQVDPGGEAGPEVGLQLALQYLQASFGTERRWGNDWFDHAKVLQVLANIPVLTRNGNYEIGSTEIDQAAESLVRGLDNDFSPDEFRTRTSEWSGAATYAAAAMAFKSVGDNTRAGICIERLLEMQREKDGAFVGIDPSNEGLLVWHTANALIALIYAGAFPVDSPPIERACRWLLDPANRSHDESWGSGQWERRVDMTAYVGRAFHHVGHQESDAVENFVENWLLEKQDKVSGSIGTLEGTIHAAVFFVDTKRMKLQDLKVSLPTVKTVEIQSVLSGLVSDVERLEVELEDERARRGKAEAELEPAARELAAVKSELDRRSSGIHISNAWQLIIGILVAVALFFVGLNFQADSGKTDETPIIEDPSTTIEDEGTPSTTSDNPPSSTDGNG